ncbi:MAG: DUF3863 domain-containing protein [Tannerella sp.]|jgi:hypothetical protein|nr:DUF3863 domain-containing protein [Tannerella sp.]
MKISILSLLFVLTGIWNMADAVTLKGNRFVTLCIMIRTTPWEVSRDVKLHPRDEADWHTLDGVRSNIWEAQLVHEYGKDFICNAMEMWVTDTKKRWPDTHFVTFGEFGNIWRQHYRTNDDWNYRFTERGSGLGDSYNNLEIRWFMNKRFRLALLRDWHKRPSPAYVIDFTRYDVEAKEPPDPSPENPAKDWSLINVINQKATRPQDTPRLISDLSPEDRELIEAP